MAGGILVVGDIVVDISVFGRQKTHAEDSAPVIQTLGERIRAGGAANVAINASYLGSPTSLFGIFGDDDATKVALDVAADLGRVRVLGFPIKGYTTPTKVRIYDNERKVLRYDVEDVPRLNGHVSEKMLAQLEDALQRASVVVISDYQKGTVFPNVANKVLCTCLPMGIPVVVNSKIAAPYIFRGASALIVNGKEAEEICRGGPPSKAGPEEDGTDRYCEMAANIASTGNFGSVVITLGHLGSVWYDASSASCQRLAVEPKSANSSVGAGDVFTSVAAHYLHCGFSLRDSFFMAGFGSACFVSDPRRFPVSKDDVVSELLCCARSKRGHLYKHVSLPVAAEISRHVGKVVFTNGVFDLLHAGHVHLLQKAREMGDALIVAINSDRSVKQLKGEHRPHCNQARRIESLAHLDCVDFILTFDDLTPEKLIQELNPHILVKGGEYRDKEVPGAAHVLSCGGEVKFVDMLPGVSTTALEQSLALR